MKCVSLHAIGVSKFLLNDFPYKGDVFFLVRPVREEIYFLCNMHNANIYVRYFYKSCCLVPFKQR